MKITKEMTPFFIAVAIGIIALIIYIASGRGSYDTGVRNLSTQPAIKSIDASDTQKVKITCKSGEKYEIVFKKEQQNYEDLIFNACGVSGTQQTEN